MEQDAIAGQKPGVQFSVFSSLDLRVARILSAPLAEGTRSPCRVLELDIGPLGRVVSIGQYALVSEAELTGKLVVICCNLGARKMGAYVSQALVLGTPHPESPSGQSQAMPLEANGAATPGQSIF